MKRVIDHREVTFSVVRRFGVLISGAAFALRWYRESAAVRAGGARLASLLGFPVAALPSRQRPAATAVLTLGGFALGVGHASASQAMMASGREVHAVHLFVNQARRFAVDGALGVGRVSGFDPGEVPAEVVAFAGRVTATARRIPELGAGLYR